jgi:chemotaxis signal transduction protein
LNKKQFGILSSFIDSIEERSNVTFSNSRKTCDITSPSGRPESVPVIKIKELLEIKGDKLINCEMTRIISLKSLQSKKKRIIEVDSIEKVISISKSCETLSMNQQRKFSEMRKADAELIEILDIEKIFMTETQN